MNKKDFVIIGLSIGLAYTGWTVYNMQAEQQDISSSLDKMQEQNYYEEIHRAYNPTSNPDITVDAEQKLTENEERIPVEVSINSGGGEFRVSKVKVTAYDNLKNELWSTTEDADFRGHLLRPNESFKFDVNMPKQIKEENPDHMRDPYTTRKVEESGLNPIEATKKSYHYRKNLEDLYGLMA
jgi:hypothetical protein